MDQLLEELSIEQLTEWQAYFELEPFGMAWHQTAQLAAILANANRDPKEKPKPFTVEDFLPTGSREGDENEPEEADGTPNWMRWKRNIRAYAESANEIKREKL